LIADLKLNVKISPKEVNNIFAVLDTNCDGMVSRRELADAFLAIKSSIL
jgi:Ca2+-binding EF-hand superfamily protein